MSISFHCPGCGARMNAPEVHAGKRGKCSKCGMTSKVPMPDPTPVQSPPVHVAAVPIQPQLAPQVLRAEEVPCDESSWDTATSSFVLAALACSLFAGCVPLAAVLGMVISAAALPATGRCSNGLGRVGGALLMFACLFWCGAITFLHGGSNVLQTADSAIKSAEETIRQEEMRKQHGYQP